MTGPPLIPGGPPSPPDDGASRRIMVNAGWLGVQPLVLNVFGILSTMFIARKLGVEAYGRFNFGLAAALTIGPMADLGLRALAVRRLAREPEHGLDNVKILLALRLLLAAFSTAALLLIAPVIGDDDATVAVIRVAAITLLPTAVMTTFIDALIAAERARDVSVANMAGGMVLTVTSVIVVGAGGREVALAGAYAAGPVVTAMILSRYVISSYGGVGLRWAPTVWRQLIREAVPFFRVGVIGAVTRRLDTLIVGRVFGDAVLGGYSAATTLVDRILIIPDSVSTAMLPTLTKMRRAGKNVGKEFGDLLLGLQLLSWPLTFATIASAPAIITLIFGSDFAPAWPILALSILALPLTSIGSLTGEALLAAGREHAMTSSALRSQVLNLVLVYPLALAGGPIGARLARIVGGFSVIVMRWKPVHHEYPELLQDRRWGVLVRTLLVASVAYGLTPLVWQSGATTLAWATIVTLGLFAAMWRLALVPRVMIEVPRMLFRRLGARTATP